MNYFPAQDVYLNYIFIRNTFITDEFCWAWVLLNIKDTLKCICETKTVKKVKFKTNLKEQYLWFDMHAFNSIRTGIHKCYIRKRMILYGNCSFPMRPVLLQMGEERNHNTETLDTVIPEAHCCYTPLPYWVCGQYPNSLLGKRTW